MASEVSVSVVNPKIPSSGSCFSDKELGDKMFGGLVSCSLKRKRPPSLEIPNVLREICTDISKISGAAAEGRGDGAVPVSCFGDSGVGVYSLKGKKKFMEDAHKIFSSSNGEKAFFGVYDGHGGSKAVEFVAENLHLKIFEMLENASECESKEEAVKAGYLKTDEEFLRQGYGSGACCVTALIEGKEMTVSNLGDCRAVLCRDGVAECLTYDHNPTREDERRRIEDKGGYVEFHRGTWRVHGTLAVSRSIGDAHLQGWVIAEPDSKVLHLTPDMEYLILASDGLWDEINNQEAVDIVKKVCTHSKKELPRSSPIPSSKSSRVSFVKPMRRIPHYALHEQRSTVEDDEPCVENESPPPAKYRRISMSKQPKIKNSFPNDENAGVVEKRGYGGGLMAACKELVDVAAGRGSWDDITVMIVDLKFYRSC